MGRRDSLLTDDVEFLGDFQVAPGLEGESWIGMKSGGVRVGGEIWNRDGERIREMAGRSGSKRERETEKRGERRGREGRGRERKGMGLQQRRDWQRERERWREIWGNKWKRRERARGRECQEEVRKREGEREPEPHRNQGPKQGRNRLPCTETGWKARGRVHQDFHRLQPCPRPQGPHPCLGSPGPGGGPPGLSPTTWSTRAWLSSPMGCKETVGVMGEVVPGGPLESPSAQHGAHHVRVGPVGQPQRPQVEVLLELGLLRVQDHELLADLSAMCPQALILGVLGVGQVGSAQEGAGVPRPV